VLFPVSESPLYVEVIDSDPGSRVLVVTVATPGVLSVPDPTDVVPFLNTTVPVGREGAVDVTVVANVTAAHRSKDSGIQARSRHVRSGRIQIYDLRHRSGTRFEFCVADVGSRDGLRPRRES